MTLDLCGHPVPDAWGRTRCGQTELHQPDDIECPKSTPDVFIAPSLSIYSLYPRTDTGQQWIADNIPTAPILDDGAAVVEARYAPPIIQGMHADGLHLVALAARRPIDAGKSG